MEQEGLDVEAIRSTWPESEVIDAAYPFVIRYWPAIFAAIILLAYLNSRKHPLGLAIAAVLALAPIVSSERLYIFSNASIQISSLFGFSKRAIRLEEVRSVLKTTDWSGRPKLIIELRDGSVFRLYHSVSNIRRLGDRLVPGQPWPKWTSF